MTFSQSTRQCRPTDEPQCGLREGECAGVQQEVEVVRAMLQGEHAEHHQEEASLWGCPQAWSRRVLIGNGLQGDGLDT